MLSTLPLTMTSRQRGFQRVAAPQHQVGAFAFLRLPSLPGHIEDACRVDGQGGQRRLLRHAIARRHYRPAGAALRALWPSLPLKLTVTPAACSSAALSSRAPSVSKLLGKLRRGSSITGAPAARNSSATIQASIPPHDHRLDIPPVGKAQSCRMSAARLTLKYHRSACQHTFPGFDVRRGSAPRRRRGRGASSASLITWSSTSHCTAREPPSFSDTPPRSIYSTRSPKRLVQQPSSAHHPALAADHGAIGSRGAQRGKGMALHPCNRHQAGVRVIGQGDIKLRAILALAMPDSALSTDSSTR